MSISTLDIHPLSPNPSLASGGFLFKNSIKYVFSLHLRKNTCNLCSLFMVMLQHFTLCSKHYFMIKLFPDVKLKPLLSKQGKQLSIFSSPTQRHRRNASSIRMNNRVKPRGDNKIHLGNHFIKVKAIQFLLNQNNSLVLFKISSFEFYANGKILSGMIDQIGVFTILKQ